MSVMNNHLDTKYIQIKGYNHLGEDDQRDSPSYTCYFACMDKCPGSRQSLGAPNSNFCATLTPIHGKFVRLKKNIGLSLIYSCERNLLLSSSCSSIFIIHLLKLHLLMLFSSQVMSDSSVTPRIVAHQAPLSMGFPINNTGVGGHALLQGIFLTQKSNSRLLHYRWIFFFFLYCRATKEAPMLHKLQSIELNRMILSLFPKANNQSN